MAMVLWGLLSTHSKHHPEGPNRHCQEHLPGKNTKMKEKPEDMNSCDVYLHLIVSALISFTLNYKIWRQTFKKKTH